MKAAKVGALAVIAAFISACGSSTATAGVSAGRTTTTTDHQRSCGLDSAVSEREGEVLTPGWIPAGFVPDAGAVGGVPEVYEYRSSASEPPAVSIARYFAASPTFLATGKQVATVDVDGQPAAVYSGGMPSPPVVVHLVWAPAPGVTLVVTAPSEAEALKIATTLTYQPGTMVTLPPHPQVTFTPRPPAGGSAALSSAGEINALASSATPAEITPAPGPLGVEPQAPVWVVLTGRDGPTEAVSAADGSVLARWPGRPAWIGAVTDRSSPACRPPFGALTRSEATYLLQPDRTAAWSVKLVALTTVAADEDFGQCQIAACRPGQLVWALVQRAGDERFAPRGGPYVPPSQTTTTRPTGTWQARFGLAATGPPDNDIGSTLTAGYGPPPASLSNLVDLDPEA